MAENRTMTTDEAEEYTYPGEHIVMQEVSKHRWYTKQLVVIDLDGTPMGFYYLDPASELQEDQDRFETDPVQLFPVTAKEVTTTVYEPATS